MTPTLLEAMLPASDAALTSLLVSAGAVELVQQAVREREKRLAEMQARVRELREAWE